MEADWALDFLLILLSVHQQPQSLLSPIRCGCGEVPCPGCTDRKVGSFEDVSKKADFFLVEEMQGVVLVFNLFPYR